MFIFTWTGIFTTFTIIKYEPVWPFYLEAYKSVEYSECCKMGNGVKKGVFWLWFDSVCGVFLFGWGIFLWFFYSVYLDFYCMSEISVCNLTWEELLQNFLLRVSLVTYPLKLYAARPVI